MSTPAIVERDRRIHALITGPKIAGEVAHSLPAHIKPERFVRVVSSSIVNDDRLAQADLTKVVRAALKIAPLGLLTDPMLGEAYLIADYRGEVQVRIGYRGLIKLALQSGQIKTIYAHEVYERDLFRCILGTDKSLIHEPDLKQDRGEIIGYYAVVNYKEGYSDFEFMNVTQINKIRDRSDGWRAYEAKKIKSTPWADAYEEMAKKTVLRRLLKRVPASPDLADAMRVDSDNVAELKDVTPGQAAPPRPSSLDAFAAGPAIDETIEAQAEAGPPHDGDGVVIEAEPEPPAPEPEAEPAPMPQPVLLLHQPGGKPIECPTPAHWRSKLLERCGLHPSQTAARAFLKANKDLLEQLSDLELDEALGRAVAAIKRP